MTYNYDYILPMGDILRDKDMRVILNELKEKALQHYGISANDVLVDKYEEGYMYTNECVKLSYIFQVK